MAPRLELFPFRYRDPRTGKWICAPTQAAIDGLERFLLLVFLRRYVTYCARRRRFAAMNGAARLFAELRNLREAL